MKRKSLSVLRLYYFLVLVVLLQIRDYKPAYRNDLLMAYFGVLQCGFYELACYTPSAIAGRDLRMQQCNVIPANFIDQHRSLITKLDFESVFRLVMRHLWFRHRFSLLVKMHCPANQAAKSPSRS